MYETNIFDTIVLKCDNSFSENFCEHFSKTAEYAIVSTNIDTTDHR